ncbi:MAG: hypothetical protein KDB00_24960 [Planctomycetales bacterium]|nr:hypothetical protein [Planctomycetales bacterium]
MSLRKHLYEVHADSKSGELKRTFTKHQVLGFVEKLSVSRRQDIRDLSAKVRQAAERVFGENAERFPGWRGTTEELESKIVDLLVFNGIDFTDQQLQILVEEFVRHVDTPLGCNGLQHKKLAKYLGFVDLRTNSPASPIALALLAVPRHLRHDRHATVIQGLYGRLFGAFSFPCTAYTMHDPTTGGAYCAQACLIMTLILLADRGANIQGSYDLTIAALRESAAQVDGNRIFPVRGLRFIEMASVLTKDLSGTSACLHAFPCSLTGRRLAQRLIVAYVVARCPVILGVDSATLNDREDGDPHTLVVVGTRRDIDSNSPFDICDLVVHDPSNAPYMTQSVEHCFRASAALGSGKGNIEILFAADSQIEVHAAECFSFIGKSYLPDHNRFVVTPSELEWSIPAIREFQQSKHVSFTSDYEVQLIHWEDIPRHLQSSYGCDPASIPLVPSGWYWVVALIENGSLEVIWLFKTRRNESDQAVATRISVVGGGSCEEFTF